jgi:DNA polymerase V
MLALVDGNNFYCSAERALQPSLADRPLVVLSSNDGACIARSEEAKALGVQMAQPWFQVHHLAKTHGLVAVSANFELYGDMSARMMAVEGRFAPRQEVYSIDESFLDFTGVQGDLTAIGHLLRAAVLQEVGIPTCVGFATTKTLAKLANHVAKSADRKPGSYPAEWAHVFNLAALTDAERDAVFKATEVGEVWGVGRRIGEQLRAGGIHTVLDLVRADIGAVRKTFGLGLTKTVQELRGLPCIDVDDSPAPRQQILVSRSFGRVITQVDGIVEAVTEFASRAAERLRQQQCVAGAIQVFFSTSPFRERDAQHSPSAVVPLGVPNGDTRQLAAAAGRAAQQLFRPGFNYAKAGVMLLDLQDEGDAQRQNTLDLFGAPAGERAGSPGGTAGTARPALMSAMDALNQRFGRDAVRLGAATLASSGAATRSWAVKQERRSPRATTRWEEIAVVRC